MMMDFLELPARMGFMRVTASQQQVDSLPSVCEKPKSSAGLQDKQGLQVHICIPTASRAQVESHLICNSACKEICLNNYQVLEVLSSLK